MILYFAEKQRQRIIHCELYVVFLANVAFRLCEKN